MWDELNTGWVLLDCELLPWSVKAEDLLRDQYASVGASARAALPVQSLEAARLRGIDVADLLGRTQARLRNAEAFSEVYRRYCWATEGLTGVRLAPFQVLASEGTMYCERDHGWHLGIADRLVAAAPDVVHPTGRLVVESPIPGRPRLGSAGARSSPVQAGRASCSSHGPP